MSQQTLPPDPDEAMLKQRQLLSSEQSRIFYSETLVITVTLLLSLSAVVALAVFVRFDEPGLSFFRILIITIFTILPAVMYYVFIASRKQSLFQEFVSNLRRLGLLQVCDEVAPSQSETKLRYFRRTRILSYIDRFESIYGPVGKQSKKDLLEATSCNIPADTENARAEPSRGRIFSPATAVPVFVATFLIGLGWIQFIPPWVGDESVEHPGNATLHTALLYNELPALFAFLGAYFFSLQMIYRRYVTNDLRASAYISVSIRIVLGVIGAWLLQVIFATGIFDMQDEIHWLLFASFVVGVFPPVLWRIMREVSGKMLVLGKVVPSLDSDLPLNTLDGLTIWHETRLEEEDIENAYNMANADIIALLVNTKMPPERIVDWVDQAILYTCVGAPQNQDANAQTDTMALLAHLGIGKASALSAAVLSAERHESLPAPGGGIDLQGVQVQSIVDGINSFSNLVLINHWRTQPTTGTAQIANIAQPGTLTVDKAVSIDKPFTPV